MKLAVNLNVPVYIKNSSVGLVNNTYDIYVQVVSSIKTSQSFCREIFIPYGHNQEIGTLAHIKDIKIRGSSIVSGWTCNKEFLDRVKQDAVKGINTSEGNLLFTVSAGLLGFYLSYYNWRPNDLLRLGLQRSRDSSEFILRTSHIDAPHPTDDFKLVG